MKASQNGTEAMCGVEELVIFLPGKQASWEATNISNAHLVFVFTYVLVHFFPSMQFHLHLLFSFSYKQWESPIVYNFLSWSYLFVPLFNRWKFLFDGYQSYTLDFPRSLFSYQLWGSCHDLGGHQPSSHDENAGTKFQIISHPVIIFFPISGPFHSGNYTK